MPRSRFSIAQKLESKEVGEDETSEIHVIEELPNHHFSETDLQREWQNFLKQVQKNDIVIYNAVSGFNLKKVDEDVISVHYPSDTAKAEFDKISTEFFNYFKQKVNHYRLEIQYKNEFTKLKKEVVTKRSIFEKFVLANPVLKELDDVFKFDLNS